MVTHRAPDVLVVVMDCVSGVDFLGGGDPVEGLRAANSLASEGVVYTKAVAPASWTVPSHASMFAGLYPWETTLDTPPGDPRQLHQEALAQRLRKRGFRTAAFSANPHIGPALGLNRGFERSEWGDFSDRSLRKLTKWVSAHHSNSGGLPSLRASDELAKSVRRLLRDGVIGAPLAADILTRLVSRLLGIGRPSEPRVAPWIQSQSITGFRACARRSLLSALSTSSTPTAVHRTPGTVV